MPFVVLFQQAEEMHQKAIKIKEELLGLEDYEVALSVGHLASLYNYDMKKYTEAETLYQRSIDISELYSFFIRTSDEWESYLHRYMPMGYRRIGAKSFCIQYMNGLNSMYFSLMSMMLNE